MIYKPSNIKKINTDLKNIDTITVINKYKDLILSKLSLKKREIDFIINNTKACNNVIKNISHQYKKPHIIISSLDESYILSYCKNLEKNNNISLSIINLNKYGYIDDISEYINNQTKLVIIPYINIDIGTINDIKHINNQCKEKNILLYSNIDYLFCRTNKYDFGDIDYISIPFINIGGPKDISLLIHKNNIKIDSTISSIKNIESIINSLLAISSFKISSKNTKKLFIKKLDEIFNIINYKDYINMYKPSISKISIILIDNNLNKYILCLSIFSKNKYINNNNFKNIENIYLPQSSSVYDEYIKKGYLIISFDNIYDESQVNKLLKEIILVINNQYNNLIEEIKDTVIAKKKQIQAPKKIKLKFDPKLTYDITDPNFKQKKYNIRKLKSVLKK